MAQETKRHAKRNMECRDGSQMLEFIVETHRKDVNDVTSEARRRAVVEKRLDDNDRARCVFGRQHTHTDTCAQKTRHGH